MITSKKIAALQSGLTRIIEVPKPEQPMLSFNRICFGLMNNDYILVVSSGVKLVVSILLLVQFNRSI
ncbi:MAG TPA: hypothetical protein VK508_22175 [Cyclobacteriaceae bacterium]|nr:hypothetical protein [Cyclobacteriaceae bacterium]